MKIMKKLAMILLSVCLAVPCFAPAVYAANGLIQFTDHTSATAGEELEVTCAIKNVTGKIGDIEINMTYDGSILKFKSGEGVTETASGSITFKGTDISSFPYRVKIKFDVLKKGNTKLEVASCSGKMADGSSLTCDNGFSSINVTSGEDVTTVPETPETPSAATTVEVNGQTYELSSEFPESEIPKDFAVATLNYAGADYKVVQHETCGMYLGYLVNAQREGKFFVYNDSDATFAPFAQVQISDTSSLILLSDINDVVVPSEYQVTTVTFNGQEFPAWQSVKRVEYCLLYAVNNRGDRALYQFDSIEGTYQRFEVEEPSTEGDTEKDSSTGFAKVRDSLEKHFDYVILGTGIGFLFFLILVIVLSVKLYNRNAELDELYDEYDIDPEDEEPDTKDKKASGKKTEKKEESDDFEDYDDIELNDQTGEAVVEEEIKVQNETFEQETEVPEEIEFEEDFYANFEEEFEEKPQESSSYEDFDLDFIDLDD